MEFQTSNVASIQELLRCYSGRRLQYAIKLGILPTPESLNQMLKRNVNVVRDTKNMRRSNS
jgi:hypothetical protein